MNTRAILFVGGGATNVKGDKPTTSLMLIGYVMLYVSYRLYCVLILFCCIGLLPE